MLTDLVINSLICSWPDLQRPRSELSALTPSSDPYSVPPAELRSAFPAPLGTAAESLPSGAIPGGFSSSAPGEPAGTARSAEAVTAFPLWIRLRRQGANRSASRCPETAAEAAGRAGSGSPAGIASPRAAQGSHRSARCRRAGGRGEGRNTAGASGAGTAAPPLILLLPHLSPPKIRLTFTAHCQAEGIQF